jgi:hypothetical protein
MSFQIDVKTKEMGGKNAQYKHQLRPQSQVYCCSQAQSDPILPSIAAPIPVEMVKCFNEGQLQLLSLHKID